MDRKTIEKVLANSSSKSEFFKLMGWKENSGYNYKKFNKLVNDYDLDISHFTFRRSSYSIEKLKDVVSSSYGYSDVMRKLGISLSGGNHASLKKKIKLNNIDISHFLGKSWNTGSRYINNGKKYDSTDIFIENSNYSRYHLKNRILKEGLLKYECEKCLNKGDWNGEALTLQLDHINGINNDNRLKNLRFLCPNCHSQTKTFAGKNINKN